MATREEVMATADRLIRRGELGDAAGLLEVWLRSHPADDGAAGKLASIRALADPSELRATRANGAVRPPSADPMTGIAPPAPKPPAAARPRDRKELLEQLLERIRENKRR